MKALPVTLDDALLASEHSTNGRHTTARNRNAHGIHESPWSMLLPLRAARGPLCRRRLDRDSPLSGWRRSLSRASSIR